MDDKDELTDFGYQQVSNNQKTAKVQEVFASVANQYDLMNDAMSFGMHRLWKKRLIQMCLLRPDSHVLDLAGGTGDISLSIAHTLGPDGRVVLMDPNPHMLARARQRIVDQGLLSKIELVQAYAEDNPYQNQFDRVVCSFGLRNMTDKATALSLMQRSLKPGGRCFILEFSKPQPFLQGAYRAYTHHIIPKLGKFLSNDSDSYRYLAESIERHPDQSSLQTMMKNAGFEHCRYQNLSAGIVACHSGFKI